MKINDKLIKKVYSTTEKVIGIWTNNKPIYEKVVYSTLDLRTSGEHAYDVGLQNVDELVDLKYRINGSRNKVVHNNAISAIGIDNADKLFIYTNVNWDNNMDCRFTIQYTKTID